MADVTIFEDANFLGRSQNLPEGQYDDAAQQLSFGNDMISSIKVPQGVVARLYEHFHFQGRFIDIEEDTPMLSQFWDNRTSSVIVYAKSDLPPVIKEVMIFEDANYTGKFQILGKGQYDTAQILIGNDTLRSALVPYGMVLRLFENASFQGAFIEIGEDTPAISMDWNDRTSSIVVDEGTIPVTIFHENELEIVDEQSFTIPDDLVAGMRMGLSKASTPISGNVTSPNAFFVERIIAARRLLNGFLSSSAFNERRAQLRNIMQELSIRHFDGAQNALNDLNTQSTPIFLTELDFVNALNSVPVHFIDTEIIEVERPNKPPIEKRIDTPRTLPGYTGPIPTDLQRAQLMAQKDFLSKGNEYRYRVDLLQAEIYVGQSRLNDAIDLYSGLLPLILPANSSRYKFITIRLAFANLAVGDTLFRKFRNLDEETKKTIRAPYEEAVNLLQSSAISPYNPRRQQIEGYATVQLSKLDAGMNFLGYHDSYVPVIKPEVLQELAEHRIERADQAIEKFRLFTSTADQIQDQLKDLNFDEEIKALDNKAAQIRVANAKDQDGITNERVNQIQSQLDSLDTELGFSLGGALLQGAASAFFAGAGPTGPNAGSGIGLNTGTNAPGVVGAVAGFASAIAQYSARKDDLEAQKRIAQVEERIAGRNIEIAKLEQQTMANTLEFLGEKINRIKNRELNPDLYYAAGGAFQALAEQHLNAAIELAYLFERAVAFLRLDPQVNGIIQFDYLPLVQTDNQGNILSAAGKLAADLDKVAEKNLPITRFQFLAESYSLRVFYPLEFSRFLQTGDMEFTLSLYELNKRRPGVWEQRIKRANVEIRGLIPITGYTGRIIHHGSFLLRDKDTTPEPGGGRFIPTDQELVEAFEQLKNGASQGVPINGVIPFVLDEGRMEISPDQIEPDLGDPSPGALRPIEGYGPAGNWRLEISDIDLRLITDVILHITYVIPQSDTDLSRRVKGLIAAYEQELSPEKRLDLITPFSLRQQFFDTFSQLIEGQASLSLSREDFPSGIDNLKLKTLVAQALDAQRKGLEGLSLEISRTDTALDLVRTTRVDGFSEDVNVEIPSLPIEERFPVEGTYTLRLPDPSQANRLDDLVLFFIYEFTEI